MKSNQQYADWKKDLRVWEATNTALGVETKIQAGILFQSLEGIAHQTVQSELTVEEIIHADGVKNILKTLDFFFSGDEIQNSFNVIDDFLKFKCTKNVSLENFLVDFQLRVNKVKATGTQISDGILGYALLNSANLSQDKQDMVKATCDKITFNKVKSQLEKIGLGKHNSSVKFSSNNDIGASKVKVEECFCGSVLNQTSTNDPECSELSSDEELNGGRVFYSFNKSRAESSSGKKYKMNPVDKFGHVRACAFCKCHYHWLANCPYAPTAIKNEIANKFRRSNSQTL